MRHDFSNLREAMRHLAETFETAMHEMMNEANEQRRELLDLHQRMYDTNMNLHDLAEIAGEGADMFIEIDEACSDVAEKAELVRRDMLVSVPVHNYEEFVDFCAECGGEILVGHDYDIDENGNSVCTFCAKPEEDEAEAEDEVETDVEDVELAETVTPVEA
jgi:hypothetical protein